jgi:DNA modification methylase
MEELGHTPSPKNPLRDNANNRAIGEIKFGKIRDALGRADYASNDVLIYQSDCVEALRSLPSQIFDLTVTSPPYNIGKEYEAEMPLEKYLKWSAEWISQVYRTSSARGSFWLNLGYVSVDRKGKAVPLPYLLWPYIPFFLIQELPLVTHFHHETKNFCGVLRIQRTMYLIWIASETKTSNTRTRRRTGS